METPNIWVVRLKSLGFTVMGVVITAVLGYFASADFANLIQEYTGTAAWGTVVAVVISQLAMHLRNIGVIKAEEARMENASPAARASASSRPPVVLI